jgi:anti-sigma regulatory factor (Ser/Thr protein kinase)
VHRLGTLRAVTESSRHFKAEAILPATAASIAKTRALLTQTLSDAGIDRARSFDALLVTSELVTNAVSHGSRPDDRIRVEFRLDGGRLSIRVRDAARGRSIPVALTPDERRPAGRGLSIVDRLANWSERIVDGQREVCAELTV